MQTVKIKYLDEEAVVSVEGNSISLEFPTAEVMESKILQTPGLFRLKLSPKTKPPPVDPPVVPTWSWPRPASGIFVHPSGTSAGLGTLTNPMSLEKALAIGGAGKDIWIRGGTYNPKDTLRPKLVGSQSAPWRIFAYPGEEVTINFQTAQRHGIHFSSSNAWQIWKGIRFTDLSTGGPGGTVYNLLKADAGHDVSFHHCQFDNCKRSGLMTNGPAAGFVFYGCVIKDNGTDTQFDHGAYCNSLSGTLTFENCFVLNNAGHQIHGYNGSSSGTYGIRGFRILENSIFTYGEPSDRFVILQDSGPKHEARDCHVIGNVCYNAFPGKDATDKDRSTIKLTNGVNSRVEGNSVWGGDIATTGSVTRLDNMVLQNSTWPKEQVWVRPSRFDSGIVHVTAFNPSKASSVAADLTGIVPAGRYEIRAASSPQKVVGIAVYSGTGTIMLPIFGLSYDAQIRTGGHHWPGNGRAAGFILRRVP